MTPETIALWLSSPRMTVRVVVRGQTIVEAAPIVRTFIRQPVNNLIQAKQYPWADPRHAAEAAESEK